MSVGSYRRIIDGRGAYPLIWPSYGWKRWQLENRTRRRGRTGPAKFLLREQRCFRDVSIRQESWCACMSVVFSLLEYVGPRLLWLVEVLPGRADLGPTERVWSRTLQLSICVVFRANFKDKRCRGIVPTLYYNPTVRSGSSYFICFPRGSLSSGAS